MVGWIEIGDCCFRGGDVVIVVDDVFVVVVIIVSVGIGLVWLGLVGWRSSEKSCKATDIEKEKEKTRML